MSERRLPWCLLGEPPYKDIEDPFCVVHYRWIGRCSEEMSEIVAADAVVVTEEALARALYDVFRPANIIFLPAQAQAAAAAILAALRDADA